MIGNYRVIDTKESGKSKLTKGKKESIPTTTLHLYGFEMSEETNTKKYGHGSLRG